MIRQHPFGDADPDRPVADVTAPWEAAESGDLRTPTPRWVTPPVARSTDTRVKLTKKSSTPIASGLTLTEFTGSGPLEGVILTADLAESTLEPTYLYPGTVASTAVLTTQANRVDAVAGVNGDFFDIGVTGAPRGVGIDDGQLINAPASGWNESMVLSPVADAYVGRLDSVVLDAKITTPGGVFPASNLNSPNIAAGGIGIYNAAWGSANRAETIDGAARVREVAVTDGIVSRIDTTVGSGAIPAGTDILLGRDAGADLLSGLALGDAVDVAYDTEQTGAEPDVAISGNVVLVRDGQVVAPEHPRHPRTAVGFDADGTTMWLVVVDGRSTASIGMTYVELANLMVSLGADDALNLDGGGSSTMVAREGADLAVVNTPSDGSQRSVPNGFGFTSTR